MYQRSLFEQDSQEIFLNKKFPEPQYLGAKYNFRKWISDNIPDKQSIRCVFDAFSGSQSMSYYFKQLGYQVICNDFLSFNNQIGKALVENSSELLTEDDIGMLFSPAVNKIDFSLIEDIYSNLFFEKSEAACIDNFRANILKLPTKYKQSLALAIMNRSMTRKVTMGHFAHTRALVYASDPIRIKRNRSLIRPIKDIFIDLVPEYNNAIFDNGYQNLSMCMNVLEAVDFVSNVDLIYLDPPYCDSHADYQSFYHLLETFTEYWKDKKFINSIKRYEPKKYSGFDKASEICKSLRMLFDKITNIPYWLISYNDRSYPSIEYLVNLIEDYKFVRVEKKIYANGRGGKGSVAGSHEVLLVCLPR